MNFFRLFIKTVLLGLVILFAIMNNDFVSFTLEPFNLHTTVSLSVLILILFFGGYLSGNLLGRLDSFVANAPLRAMLRNQKKANKVLNKEQEKLHEKVSSLQENLENLKGKQTDFSKTPLKDTIAKFFSFKK